VIQRRGDRRSPLRHVGLKFPNSGRQPAIVHNAVIIGECHNVPFGRFNAGVEGMGFPLIFFKQIFDRQIAVPFKCLNGISRVIVIIIYPR